ncbi:hypothetical protein SISSUDRAFT_1067917 [Sistotremastrum suecicum HHB10207 ss-3]|uniref:Uncharacterized protein n=1 Tax=Sistotremastrum suecicum HHB10207 ss-3 TaxID=1314776 RepID=A0A165WKC0_9AGAM|nr:hypothetical protein SISSUDRAFT_1067917 [Sistotremastrum suecicum HHB10207 ss-3]
MTPPSSTDRGDRENSHSTNFPNLCSVPLLHESGVGFGKINRVVGGWARDLTSILPSDPIDNSLPRSALSKSVTTKATCTLRHPSALRHCFLRSGRISEDRTNWRSSRTYLPGCSVRFRQIDRTGRTSLSPKLPNFCSSSSFVICPKLSAPPPPPRPPSRNWRPILGLNSTRNRHHDDFSIERPPRMHYPSLAAAPKFTRTSLRDGEFDCIEYAKRLED